MGNMILACPVISDAATITTSTTAAGLPKDNLKKSSIGQVTRFMTPGAAFIRAHINGEVNLVALLGHNGSTTGSVRVRAATLEADILTAPDYDSGNLPIRSNQPDFTGANTEGAMDRNHFILPLPSAMSYPFWRIDIADSALTYLDVGRLYIAKAWQPATNMDYGLSEGWIDPSKTERTVSGRQVPLRRPAYRYADFQLSFASEAEIYDNAFEIDRLRGSTRDVLFVGDPDNKVMIQRRSIYGTMQSLAPIVNARFQLFEKSYRIEEIIE